MKIGDNVVIEYESGYMLAHEVIPGDARLEFKSAGMTIIPRTLSGRLALAWEVLRHGKSIVVGQPIQIIGCRFEAEKPSPEIEIRLREDLDSYFDALR